MERLGSFKSPSAITTQNVSMGVGDICGKVQHKVQRIPHFAELC